MKTLADLTAPAAIKRKPMLESELQAQCAEWARARGYWARKFSSISQRSVPDYLFARRIKLWDDIGEMTRSVGPTHTDLKFACEFKRPGTKPQYLAMYDVTVMSTEAQYEEQQAMKAQGWTVFECDNFDDFKAVVRGIERDAGEI